MKQKEGAPYKKNIANSIAIDGDIAGKPRPSPQGSILRASAGDEVSEVLSAPDSPECPGLLACEASKQSPLLLPYLNLKIEDL